MLAKQFPDGIWYLNTNLVIAEVATLHSDSTDTKWQKISSSGTPRIIPVTAYRRDSLEVRNAYLYLAGKLNVF